MQVHYDKTNDAIFLKIADEPITDSEEVHPGVVLDFDAHGNLVAVEVYRSGGKRAQIGVMPNDEVAAHTGDLGSDLRSLRDQLHSQGVTPLTIDEFDRELAERHGE